MVVKGRGVRARESQAPFQILMCDDEGVISTGTAFLFALNDRLFLVTNWHNLSGKDFISGARLGGRVPTFVKARLATPVDETGGFSTVSHRVDIYDPESGRPLWLEHPTFKKSCDVIALPFQLPTNTPDNLHVAANLIHSIPIPVRPGTPVFIIGFPRSLSVHIGWPIWKSGFIASEPFYDVTIGGQLAEIGGRSGGTMVPAFFVDALTRSGMSGSPVFANYVGNWDMTDPYRSVDPDSDHFWSRDDVAIGENRLEFVGVYSGRVPTQEGEAALGLCFKKSAIEEICAGGNAGKHPHFI